MMALVAVALNGCATGLPLGARASLRDGYEPLARATPIEVPDDTLTAEPTAQPLTTPPGARDTTVALARKLVGAQHVRLNNKTYGDDCTGLVRGLYESVGVNLMTDGEAGDNGVTAIWRFTAQHGRLYDGGVPVAGDLVFFRETYDLNRDGAVNDGLTHIGLVDDVEGDGTVIVIHRVARGVVRYRMNLTNPSQAKDATGKVINDGLRLPGAGSPQRLTGELFVSFGTLLPNERVAAR